MKNNYTIWIGVLLITIFFSQTSCSPVSSSMPSKTEHPNSKETDESHPTSTTVPMINPAKPPLPDRAEDIQKIHNATVLIRVQTPQMQNVYGFDTVIGLGMGSLIRRKGETLLVTHNHWGELLQEVAIVEFRNADNQMIIPILGYEFKGWIVYQDAGTLVLKLPQELFDPSAPISMEAIPQVATGEIVDVVYLENPAREKATIQQAVVEEVITYKGLPAYRLRSLDGQPIKPGDSGGGIYYKGRLVGNNWVTVIEKSGSVAETSGNSEVENILYTGLSIAAILPLDIP